MVELEDPDSRVASKRTRRCLIGLPVPRSSRTEMAAFREAVIARARYICEWPGCEDPGEALAHLTHRGMGGSKERNRPDNAAWLCERHHDILDGRTALGTLRWELNEMLRHVIAIH